ncbi:MAG: nitronate monooxygenase [Cyclobacteriaceae bacterium]
MWNRTKATELLQIKYPIIQGPFGGKFSSVKLVATVSNAGGMGSFGLNAYDAAEIVEIAREIKKLTSKPYALNLWVPLKEDPIDSFDELAFEKVKKTFKPYFDRVGLPLPKMPDTKTGDFDQQVEAVLKSNPPVASFIFGIPAREIISEFKKQGIVTMATATTVEEAHRIEEAAIDIVIASGQEAGGHRASFLKPAEESLHPTSSLIPQVVNTVHIPIIAAGGISNGLDIARVLKMGASAAQLGTAFLATNESAASHIHKSKLLAREPIKTDLTKVYTGRLARAISNKLSDDFKRSSNESIAPYPIQSNFLSTLMKNAHDRQDYDYVAFWSGQPSTLLTHQSASELFDSLKNDVTETLGHEAKT